MDVLEHASVSDVVIPGVVLEEVKARNASTYARLRGLAANEAKRFFVFANEHHRWVQQWQRRRQQQWQRQPRSGLICVASVAARLCWFGGLCCLGRG